MGLVQTLIQVGDLCQCLVVLGLEVLEHALVDRDGALEIVLPIGHDRRLPHQHHDLRAGFRSGALQALQERHRLAKLSALLGGVGERLQRLQIFAVLQQRLQRLACGIRFLQHVALQLSRPLAQRGAVRLLRQLVRAAQQKSCQISIAFGADVALLEVGRVRVVVRIELSRLLEAQHGTRFITSTRQIAGFGRKQTGLLERGVGPLRAFICGRRRLIPSLGGGKAALGGGPKRRALQ